ncbi:MAG: tetratricopeptide repeat protein [Gemmatimonadales bacterium]
MTAPRPRDATIVAALAQRLGAADAATLTNLAWFAARRGATTTALDAVRHAVTLADAPRAAWRTLERLAVGRTDQLLLALPSGHPSNANSHGVTHPLAAAVAAHAQGAFAVAEACYWAATSDGSDAAAAWNGLAVLHEERGERAAADEAWRHVSQAPAIATIHDRALSWHRRGESAGARALLRDALTAFPRAAPLLYLAGYLAYLGGEAAASVPLLSAAVAAESAMARAHFTLGLAHERLGAHTLAVEATRRGLQCSPWFVPEVWLLENGRGGELVEVAPERSAGTAAATDEVLLALGRSLLETLHLGEALSVFDQVLVRQPAHTAALFHRGVVLAKLRRYSDAFADWEAVGRADGESVLGEMSRRHAHSARELATLFSGS